MSKLIIPAQQITQATNYVYSLLPVTSFHSLTFNQVQDAIVSYVNAGTSKSILNDFDASLTYNQQVSICNFIINDLDDSSYTLQDVTNILSLLQQGSKSGFVSVQIAKPLNAENELEGEIATLPSGVSVGWKKFADTVYEALGGAGSAIGKTINKVLEGLGIDFSTLLLYIVILIALFIYIRFRKNI
jgi:hypothetical protein